MASSPSSPSAAMPPRSGSGSTPDIDPQLENVLRNLNVNLEDELIRYRRQRHGQVPPPPPPRRMAQRHTIDLISVPATAAGSSGGASQGNDVTTPSVPSGQRPTPPPPNPSGQRPTPPPVPPNPFLDQAESGTDLDLPDMDLGSADAEPTSELDSLMAEIAQAEAEANMALPVHANDLPTEGYLESSEELLKSMAEDQVEPDSMPEPYSPERKNNGLLKMAGLILVLLGGVGVGFAITYPSQLQKLRSQFWPAGTELPDAATPETPAGEGAEVPPTATDTAPGATATAPEVNPDGYKPPGPDLSTREFKELDLESLSTLDVDDGSATAPTIPPLTNPAQTPIPAATPTPAGQPGASPTVPGATLAPTPATLPPPTAVTGSNFYVIASYTGDDSLNKARELVPDAFVRNFQAGARIQLAAFDNRAQAEEQVTALKQQGATVELFGPTNE
ncbi:hypothetical protein [Leptothoe sp. PORK10 BA2]|uniref:hypothetical protein n=1 Tax=Leptothoe sp. PORK10 BA2 TaxID=3110254 RepID=UPI002B20E87A|nr:hypothetical protein [Leptothoe sp. PORK10 BA2]MEA5465087.1 hypothetical protein [Leptothoe sp. PORK10 BA2]